MEKSFDKRLPYLIGTALVLITFAVFWQVLTSDFLNYDDDYFVTDNHHVQLGLKWQSIKWALTTLYQCFWHPLVWLSYLIDRQIFGPGPFGFHLVNLLLHLANVFLLFIVMDRFTRSIWKSAFVAALFGIHPLHVESVAWISERKDVLSTLFWILTMWAYLFYVEKPGVKRYLLVLVLFFFGLTAKSMLMTLPIVLLLFDYWPLRRTNLAWHSLQSFFDRKIRNLVLEKLPLLVLSIAFGVISIIAQRKGGAMSTLADVPLWSRIGNAFLSYAKYILKMFWPRGLAAFYPHPGHELPIWQAIVSALVLMGITVMAFRLAAKRPYFVVGWLWYVITLIPVIGIIQVGSFGMADRFTYVPLIGLFIVVAWGLPDLIALGRGNEKGGERVGVDSYLSSFSSVLPLVSCISITALSICTWFQVGYWKNSKTLFTHTLAVTRNNFAGHLNLGIALEVSGNVNDAIRHYYRALEINPLSDKVYNNLGVALEKQGRLKEAIECLQKAVELKPNSPDAHGNLAMMLADAKRFDEAVYHCEELLRLAPDDPVAHWLRGRLHAAMGNLAAAEAEFRQSLRLQPNFADGHFHLGLVLKSMGRDAEAEAEYRETIRLNPNHSAAHNNLGNMLFSRHDYEGAIDEYRRAVEANPQNQQAQNNLAAALLYSGNYLEAWRQVQQCKKRGIPVHPAIIRGLSAKMREPK
ncbi:MAG: tetratricopeptide repeat protein [Armatimonadota bacterium]|nr:tetratricopeptide repeat protein [Armatimonadota bacterium]